MKNQLWYHTPPAEWMEGLPIGNGRLAAMVWGDAACDRLSLNHEWLWRGVHRDRTCEPVAAHLPEVRSLLAAGRFFEATALANLHFGGLGGMSGMPHRVDPYHPACDHTFTFSGPQRFIGRSLDLDDAVARMERRIGDTAVKAECIAHPDTGTILCRWIAEGGCFGGTLAYGRAADPHATEAILYTPGFLAYDCAFAGGIAFRTRIDIRTDGRIEAGTDGLRITDATELLVSIDIGTSVKGIDAELAAHTLPDKPWHALLESHRNRFSELLGRLSLTLDVPENPLPTDERIRRMKAGESDPSLPLLYFHYGRYLLAASSLTGELPANLQGKWNDAIAPAWDCDYHFDINLQMNYWMTEAANMPECAEALIRYLERFVPHARQAAKDLYGCRGIWFPLTSDAWGRATPEAYGWGVWIGSAAWVAQHLWRHWEYNGNRAFLETRAYPFFREVARFYGDYLQEDAQGTLQLMPSQSPENRFEGTGSWPVSIGISSAMDVQLCYDALTYAIDAARLLGCDASDAALWQSLRDRLPPFGVGSDGRLLEWERERVEVEPGHRHLSHLYGLHPSTLFNPDERPVQHTAAIRSLESRLAQGGGHTGWSRAWVACFSARIGRGEAVWEHLTGLIKDFATVSLLDLHPPRIFQIDGNLGAVEAVLMGFVQHYAGKIHLLRAVPSAWPTGRLEGVKVPGGHMLTLIWENASLRAVAITLGFEPRAVLAGQADALTAFGLLPEGCRIVRQGSDLLVEGMEGAVLTLRSGN